MTDTTENKELKENGAGKWKAWYWTACLLLLALVYFYFQFPGEDIGPQQPIFFSHRVHAGVKRINCRFCHPYVERGENAGLPEVEKCFYCHNYIIPLHPQIAKEREHYNKKIPIPWVKIYFIPDHVKFRHQPHIQWGKIECARCHGEVQTMDRLKRVDFEMGFCITCHKERNAQLDCWLACHR